MIEIIVSILAGIGLFMVGMRHISDTLKHLSNRKLRRLFSRWAKGPFSRALWGLLLGIITQSSSSASFIVTGLVSGRIIPLRYGILIITWAEIGTTFLVFLAAIQFKVIILFLLALTGIFYKKDAVSQHQQILTVIFGIALLLFGFDFVKINASALVQNSWAVSLLQNATGSLLLLFLLGALLRFVAQSSSAVALLAIPLYSSGLLLPEGMQMMVYGTCLGSAVATLAFSANIKGIAKQTILFKVLEDLTSSVLMVSLLYLELWGNIPLIKALVGNISSNPAQQTAMVFTLTKLTPAIFVWLTAGIYDRLIQRLSPETAAENIGRLAYLQRDIALEPETVVEMSALESARILRHFPDYLEAVRQEKGNGQIKTEELHQALSALLKELSLILQDLYSHPLNNKTSEDILRQQRQTDLIISLAKTLNLYVSAILNMSAAEKIQAVIHKLTEPLHLMLLQMSELYDEESGADREILLKMTHDLSPAMEELRRRHIEDYIKPGSEEQYIILRLTELFQRAVWLIHHWAAAFENEAFEN
jgi:phosphate:Na+ symporter